MKAFISYSAQDRPFVKRLKRDLAETGVDVWSAEDAIKPGELWAEEIKSAIEKSNTVIVVLSKESLENDWVRTEIALALSENMKGEGKRIIPIVVDKSVKKEERVPYFLRDIQWLDLSNEADYEKHFDRLVEALKSDIPTKRIDKSAKLDLIKSEKKLLEKEKALYIQKKEIWTSTIMATLATTTVASIIVISSLLLLPTIRREWTLIITFLAGMSVSLIAKLLYGYFKSRTNKETRYEEAENE